MQRIKPAQRSSIASGGDRAVRRRRRGFPQAASIPSALTTAPAKIVPFDGPTPGPIGALAGSAAVTPLVTSPPAGKTNVDGSAS